MNEQNFNLIEISRLLGLSPAALSNWQRRFPDFPEPASTFGKRRLYRMQDIRAFMERNGLRPGMPKSNAKPDSGADDFVAVVSRQLRTYGIRGADEVLILAVIAVVLCNDPTIVTDDGIDLRQILRTSPIDVMDTMLSATSGLPEWCPLVLPNEFRVQHGQISEKQRQSLARAIREYASRSTGGRQMAQFTVHPGVALLMNRIARGLHVLDLCSGLGTILHEYGGEARELVGAEISQLAVHLHSLLNLLDGVDVEVLHEDSLATPHEDWLAPRFDVVVAVPPAGLRLHPEQINDRDRRWIYRPLSRLGASEDFWIQAALAYLKPGALNETTPRAVLAVRSSWLTESSGAPIREALLKSGVIEAVIEIGVIPGSGSRVPMCLIVLHKPAVPGATVRLIDARRMEDADGTIAKLDDAGTRKIVDILNSAGKTSGETQTWWRDIAISDVVNDDSILVLGRHLQTWVKETPVAELLPFVFKSFEQWNSSARQLGEQSVRLYELFLKSWSERPSSSTKWIFVADHRAASESPVVSLFLTRRRDADWTSDEILANDIVVGLFGTHIGDVRWGRQFIESKDPWQRVWVLRVRGDQVRPNYVYSWARFGDLQRVLRDLRRASTTFDRHIRIKDLHEVRMPLPGSEVQAQLADLAERISDLEARFRALEETHVVGMAAVIEAMNALLRQLLPEEGEQP